MKFWRVLLHIWCLTCLGGAVFLELLVLLGIAVHGALLCAEPNRAVLIIEVASALFSLAYFVWLARRTLKRLAEELI